MIYHNIMTKISTQNNEVKLLNKLGFNEREIAIYLALLNNGSLLPQHLARKTGIKRTTLYEIFPEMMKRGIITEITQGKRRLLQAIAPDKIFSQYEEDYQEIKKSMTELSMIYRMQGLKPKIDFYEGLEGLKIVYNDTLNSKSEILLYDQVSRYNEQALKWIIEKYVPERVKKGITVRAIVPKGRESVRYLGEQRNELREVRYVPGDRFPFRIEGMIYGNKIAFETIEIGGPLVGIIIESKQIADTLRALFDLAWRGAASASEKLKR